MKRSQTVSKKVEELYALMATAAAQRAISKIGYDDANAAEKWAETAAGWMDRSSAQAINWNYRTPKL
jgi:hypothetical protein